MISKYNGESLGLSLRIQTQETLLDKLLLQKEK